MDLSVEEGLDAVFQEFGGGHTTRRTNALMVGRHVHRYICGRGSDNAGIRNALAVSSSVNNKVVFNKLLFAFCPTATRFPGTNSFPSRRAVPSVSEDIAIQETDSAAGTRLTRCACCRRRRRRGLVICNDERWIMH